MIHILAFIALVKYPRVDLPTTPITSHLQAMTVQQALGLISKKAGVQLNANDSLKHDIVLIRADDAPLNELGRQMSLALDATWAASGAGFVLSRSADALKKEIDDQLIFDAACFARTQTNIKAVDQSYGEWNEQSAKVLAKEMLHAQADPKATPVSLHRLEIQTPVMRLFTRLMASISPTELAQVPPWGRVVYTVRPNKEQRPLPAEGASALIAFASDQLIWADAAEPFANLNLSAGLASAKPYRSSPAKVYLAFHRGESSKLDAEMRIVDSGGTNLSVVQSEIVPTYVASTLPEVPDQDAQVIPFPTSVALYQVLRSKKDIHGSPNEAVLRKLVGSPEGADPLATLPADLIDSVTQGVAKNLVAVIPDEAFELFDTLDLKGLTKYKILIALKDLQLQGSVDKDWVRIVPTRLAASHEERLDRTLLGKLLQSAADGPAHIEDVEEIADSPGGVTRSPLFLEILQTWSHSLHDQVAACDWLAFRTFGMLSADEQKTLQSGGELKVLETSPDAQKCVREMIDRGLYSNPRDTRNGVALLALQPLEQTNMLSSGITPDATLSGTFVGTPLATVGPPPGRLASDDDKKVPLSDVLTQLAAGTPVEYGMSYTLDLKVHIFPSLYSGGLVTENFYMGLAKSTADLPDEYKHAIARYQKN